MVLHTAGNIYSNLDLWLHGQAEWQASTGAAHLIRETGADASFRTAVIALIIIAAATAGAYYKLSRAARKTAA